MKPHDKHIWGQDHYDFLDKEIHCIYEGCDVTHNVYELVALRDYWINYLSNWKTIDQSGYMDNYTDADRARKRVIEIRKEVRKLLYE